MPVGWLRFTATINSHPKDERFYSSENVHVVHLRFLSAFIFFSEKNKVGTYGSGRSPFAVPGLEADYSNDEDDQTDKGEDDNDDENCWKHKREQNCKVQKIYVASEIKKKTQQLK